MIFCVISIINSLRYREADSSQVFHHCPASCLPCVLKNEAIVVYLRRKDLGKFDPTRHMQDILGFLHYNGQFATVDWSTPVQNDLDEASEVNDAVLQATWDVLPSKPRTNRINSTRTRPLLQETVPWTLWTFTESSPNKKPFTTHPNKNHMSCCCEKPACFFFLCQVFFPREKPNHATHPTKKKVIPTSAKKLHYKEPLPLTLVDENL